LPYRLNRDGYIRPLQIPYPCRVHIYAYRYPITIPHLSCLSEVKHLITKDSSFAALLLNDNWCCHAEHSEASFYNALGIPLYAGCYCIPLSPLVFLRCRVMLPCSCVAFIDFVFLIYPWIPVPSSCILSLQRTGAGLRFPSPIPLRTNPSLKRLTSEAFV